MASSGFVSVGFASSALVSSGFVSAGFFSFFLKMALSLPFRLSRAPSAAATCQRVKYGECEERAQLTDTRHFGGLMRMFV